MTYARALADAKRWAECIRAYGVPVSIELQPGAGGKHWWVGTHQAAMAHHTVSRPSQGKTPVLGLIKRGRGGSSPVPAPLANAYGGYDHVARLITMGLANHPGAGGPITLGGKRIPKDNGRPYFLGWEFEGGLEDWTEADHDFQARCIAGTLDFLGAPIDDYCEHKDWAPIRKIDRLGYTRAQGLRRIQAVKKTTTQSEEDDMPKAIIFESAHKGGQSQYVAFPNAREYDYIESDSEREDYKNILRRQGFQVEDWKNASGSMNVGNPDVFGRYVGPAAFRPVNAKRESLS